MRVYTVIVGLFALIVAKAPVLVTAAFPSLIPLPANFGPEGIAVGTGHTFYVGSLAAATLGQILVGDLRTGEVSELVAPSGRPALGMKYDERSDLLFVAGAVPAPSTTHRREVRSAYSSFSRRRYPRRRSPRLSSTTWL